MLTVLSVFIAAWFTWAFWGRVAVFRQTHEARLSIEQEPYLLESRYAGEVVRSFLAEGKEVKKGELLVELEVEGFKLEIKAQDQAIEGLEQELATLKNRQSHERQSWILELNRRSAEIEQSTQSLQDNQALALVYAQVFQKMTQSRQDGLITEMQFLASKMENQKITSLVNEQRQQLIVLENGFQHQKKLNEVQEKRMSEEFLVLKQRLQEAQSKRVHLQYESQIRQILAPVSGKMGEFQVLNPNSFIDEGEHLGTVLVEDTFKVIAWFPTEDALGLLKKGQHAQIRFEGFPWLRYGSMTAVISHVAGEATKNGIRVTLAPVNNPGIPLIHGLPCSVEVEIERTSPWNIFLNLLGAKLKTEPLR